MNCFSHLHRCGDRLVGCHIKARFTLRFPLRCTLSAGILGKKAPGGTRMDTVTEPIGNKRADVLQFGRVLYFPDYVPDRKMWYKRGSAQNAHALGKLPLRVFTLQIPSKKISS